MSGFHEQSFDEGTQLKLAMFQGYIREWLPTFLTSYQGKNNYSEIWLFDFFAGPGTDKDGKPGTPLIIIREIQKYFQGRGEIANNNVAINVVFNDLNADNIEKLKVAVGERAELTTLKINVIYHSAPFQTLLPKYINTISSPHCPCLVIIDQFGVKEVNQSIFEKLVNASTTDVMFFISSSFFKRFRDFPFTDDILPLSENFESVEWNNAHRKVCEAFKDLAKKSKEYYVAPFSIKKGSNIWGIIFGSSLPLGLEKFLNVAWKIDPKTGEANFPIDNDPISKSPNQKYLFDDMNVTRKEDAFRESLIVFLRQKRSNHDVYIFALERGFPPPKVNSILRSLHGSLCFGPTGVTRLGAYHIGWEHYRVRGTAKDMPIYLQYEGE